MTLQCAKFIIIIQVPGLQTQITLITATFLGTLATVTMNMMRKTFIGDHQFDHGT